MSKYVIKPDLHTVNTRREESLTDILVIFAATIILIIAGLFVLSVIFQQVALRVTPSTEQKLLANTFNLAPGREVDHADFLAILLNIAPQNESYTVKYRVECSHDINAYALPGGTIVLTQGLLENIKTEQGLAFVVGHEIGHLMNRDHLRGVGLWVTVGLAKLFTGVGDLPFFDSLQVLLSAAHSRIHELQADDYAIGRLKQAYPKIYNATEFFNVISQSKSSQALWFLSSHPMTQDRLENAREKTQESVLNSSPRTEGLSQKVRLNALWIASVRSRRSCCCCGWCRTHVNV